MQAELQGRHVVADQGALQDQGRLRLTSKIGKEGSRLVKPRISGFCGDRAGDKAAMAVPESGLPEDLALCPCLCQFIPVMHWMTGSSLAGNLTN
jgi:hypothetical protein